MDATHLFSSHVTWIVSARRAAGKYMYDFVHLLAPHLDPGGRPRASDDDRRRGRAAF